MIAPPAFEVLGEPSYRMTSWGPEMTPASSAASACGILKVEAGVARVEQAADGSRTVRPFCAS